MQQDLLLRQQEHQQQSSTSEEEEEEEGGRGQRAKGPFLRDSGQAEVEREAIRRQESSTSSKRSHQQQQQRRSGRQRGDPFSPSESVASSVVPDIVSRFLGKFEHCKAC